MTKDLVLIILFVLTQLLNSSQNLLLVIIKWFFKKKNFHQGAQGRLGGVVTLTLRTKILTLDRTQILAQI